MREVDEKALEAQKDRDVLESLIIESEQFILGVAYRVTGRYVSKSDDEWSICLSAFYEAVKAYSFEKGAFLSFAELVISRRLYDWKKKQFRHYTEISIDSLDMDDAGKEEPSLRMEVETRLSVVETDDAKLEIQAAAQLFQSYGFSFMDLASASPKAVKTREACAKAILYVADNPLLLSEMRRTRTLPSRIIEKNCGVPRKTLERHRKYIIAGVEIMTNDFPILSEYFSYVRRQR